MARSLGRQSPHWHRTGLEYLSVLCVLGGMACASHDERPVASSARRVISLVPSVTDLIVALGAEQRLVGRTRYDTDPRLARLPSVGGSVDPSIETIVALRPDLALVWTDSASPRVAAKLRQTGVRVETVGTSTIRDLRETIRDLGHLLSVERSADSLLRAIDESLAVIRASTSGARRPRVLYLVSRHPLITAGAGTFIDEVIEVAGGRNIFHDQLNPWPQVSMEEVLRRDPEVILVPTFDGDERLATRLRRLPEWALTAAVRSGRVFAVAADLFDRPGPRIVVAARTLRALLRQSGDVDLSARSSSPAGAR
jgi:iron complex transport system substrate-binding protein